MDPRKRRGGLPRQGNRPEVSPPSSTATGIVPDWRDRRAALDRLEAQENQRRIATWLHRYAPLTEFYGPRSWAA